MNKDYIILFNNNTYHRFYGTKEDACKYAEKFSVFYRLITDWREV